MDTRKYSSPLGWDISLNKATKGRGWKGLKGQAALALAVSLWIAGGGVGVANTIYLDHTTDAITADAAYPDGAEVKKPAGTTKTLSITGGDWSDWNIFGSVETGYDNTPLDGYQLILSGVKYKTIKGAYCPGAAINNVIIATDCTGSNQIICGRSDVDVTGNKITLTNVTLSGTGWNTAVVGGYTQNITKKASGNKVSLTNSTVGAVFGGFNSHSDGLGDTSGNTVNLLGGNTINGDLAGGNGADNTGNILTLSGVNTVQAGTGGQYVSGTVKNFETINIVSAAWDTPVLTLNGAGMAKNANGTWATIDTRGITFSGVDALNAGQKTTLIKNKMTGFGGQFFLENTRLAQPLKAWAQRLFPGMTLFIL